MGFIDHQHGVMAARERVELRKRGEIAVHAVDGFHRDEDPARAGFARPEQRGLERRHVIMARTVARGGRGVEAFLDAGMDMLVEDNGIAAAGESAEQGEIREEAAAEEERFSGAEELRRGLFEARMGLVVPAQQPRTARAGQAGFTERGDHRLAQRGIAGEAEIIVRGEVDATGQREAAMPVGLLQPRQFGGDLRR